jgi:DNA uptake protein ComE-like DNA-binding protein
MQHRILSTVVIAISLSLYANLSAAAESKPAATSETKSTDKAKPVKKSAKATAAPKIVDINSASKAELMKLPGIGTAEADKIIAGRPYLTKAHLVTHQVLPAWIYEGIKGQIMAKPNKASEAKLEEMAKQRAGK